MVLNARAIFYLLVFFCWNDFSHKNKSTIRSLFATASANPPPQLKSTMSSPVLTIAEGMKTKNQNKTNIGIWSVVKAKVGELEKTTREGRSRRSRKEVVRYVQYVAGKRKFLVQFKDG